jgi:hypothetical protein
MEIKFQKMLDEIKDKDSVLSFNRTSLKKDTPRVFFYRT